jgi:hypothetical protein
MGRKGFEAFLVLEVGSKFKGSCREDSYCGA